MQLLIVRHGIAEEREAWAPRDDTMRPLTPGGRRKMKAGARGLRTLVPRLDLLATSPLTRAMQTAEILAKTYEVEDVAIVEALVPGARPESLEEWLRAHAALTTVAVVGHEPGLGTAVSWLTARIGRPLIELGKGGACLLQLGTRLEAGQGTIVWLLRPGHLRALAD
jgi:phosphohistidine phosphatase